MDKGKIIYIDD
jgi:hypothetical protein